MNNRIDYLDTAKGILIITVVLSHSSFKLAQYMYWFHMPAFFIISGILYKNNINFKHQLIKFYIPYTFFSIVDISVNLIVYERRISLSNFIFAFRNYIYSGKAARGVFWFIPALLISKYLFDKMHKHLKSFLTLIIISLGYLGAHLYSIMFIPNTITLIDKRYWIFLGLDVIPICLSYYAIGFYSKNILNFILTKYALILSFVVSLYLIHINTEKGFYYYLNIKYSFFKAPILDLIYPITFSILILSLSNNIKNTSLGKFLSLCGENSLIIMYLHIPVKDFFLMKFPESQWLLFTLFSITICLIISISIEKRLWSSVLFKGDLSKK